MKLSTRAFFLTGLALSLAGSFAFTPLSNAAEADEAWTGDDTRMANQYVRLLEVRPEYSKVLDLLWEHYESHGSIDLLLSHYKASAEASGATPQVRLVYAHLLRKSGDLPLARLRYEQLVNEPAIRPIVLLGLADLARELLPNPSASEAYLEELAREPGISAELIRGSMMALANVYTERGNSKAALRVWRRFIELFPEDLGMLQELAARMIAAGFLKDAIEVYGGLRDDPDPGKRVAVLVELGRLYELANDFDGAAEALNEGRESTHFKHHTHLEFLSLLVRLYERQGRLEELEAEFIATAGGGRASEKALYTLVRFYEMTASPAKHQKWLRKLVKAAPGRPDYRKELVEVLLSNDHYEDAKQVLEGLLAGGAEETLGLRLLRVQIELSAGGRDAGAALLSAYLVGRDLGDQERSDVLRFAEENYLDEIAESLLRDELGEGSGEAVFSLVNLHYSRGRLAEAKAVLENHVELAGDDAGIRAERLFDAAAALQNMELSGAAIASLKEAVALQPSNLKYIIRLAEIQSDTMKIDAALEQYELAWQLCETADDRHDIDQRIYSLLQLSDLQAGNAVGQDANSFRVPSLSRPGMNDLARFLRAQGLSDVEPQAAAGGSMLYDFYAGVRERALEEAAPDLQLRAAWWAHRLGDYATAYRLLEAFRDANPDHLRAERLLLDVAVSSGDDHLALRQLDLLSKLDDERKMEYAMRRAQLRLRQGDEKHRDEALQDLALLAQDEDATAGVLANLARVYERLGRVDEALKIYRRAFDKGSLHEKRALIVELSRLQVQTGAIDGALDAMTDLVREEHDVLQRRKELSSQAALAMRHQRLDKLGEDYEALQRKYPLEPFYTEALAFIYERAGKSREAFAAIKKAYYSARKRDAHLLERMRHLAAETKDVNAAIYYQRQLVAVPDNRAQAGEWHKLIRMLELDFQVQEADRIRLRLESKFAQDPDVLGELARYYLDARQPSAARRVLGRMVRLRPWDVTSLLTLGVLEREAGQVEEAAKRFYLVLKHTQEAASASAASPDHKREIEHFPLRGFSKDARPGLMNGNKSLERIVQAIDEVRLVDNRLRSQVAQYLESGRAEFMEVPDQPAMQRLRAIEELGEIAAGSSDPRLLDQWNRYWERHPPGAGEEAFWAAWCGGDWPRAWDILRAALADPKAGPGEFFLFVYGARMNRVPQLLEWIEESSATSGARQRRLTWLLSAVYLLARDSETFPPEDQLVAFFESKLVTSPHTYTLLNLLHKEGKVREALRVGEIAKEHGRVIDGFFDGSLALLAGASGEEAEQRTHLRAAAEKIDPSSRQFQEAAVALYALLESDDQRSAHLEWVLHRLGEAPESSRTAFGRAWILALAGEKEAATAAFREVVSLHLSQAKLVGASLTGTFITESSQWMSLFDYAHNSRRLGFSETARIPFLEALQRYDLVAPRSDETAAQFQQFQHYFFQQLLWAFEGLPFSARKAQLRSHEALFFSVDDRESFARMLAGEEFHRDTVPIYRELLYKNPLDNDYSRAFFGACEKAREFEPALEYLNSLLGKQIDEPEGASGEFLQGRHALFLSMARNVERLEVFAEEQLNVGRELSPSGRHYHHALAELHAESGRLEEAARIYAEIDDGTHRALPLLSSHARVLRDLGRENAAIGLLERVELGNPASPSDRLLIEDLAPLYAATGELEKLRGLAVRSLEHPVEDLSVSMAEVLLSAGMESEAESLLLLAMRRTQSDASRLRLLVPAIGIALDSSSFARVAPLLEIFFTCEKPEAKDEQSRLIELIREAADGPHASSLRPFLEEHEKTPRSAAIACACLLELELASPSSASPQKIRALVDRLTRSRATATQLVIALESLIAHDSIVGAGRLLAALKERRARVSDHAALAIRVHDALGEDAAVAALFQQLIRQRLDSYFTLNAQTEIPEAFAAIGEPERAARIYRHYYDQIPMPGSANSEFIEKYTTFLVGRGAFYEAENVLRRAFRKSADFDPALIVDLYERWGRLDELSGRLGRFDLSSGLLKEVEFLAERRRIGEGKPSETAMR